MRDWEDLAKCKGMDPNIFIVRSGVCELGKAICNGTDTETPCPVRMQCLEFKMAFELGQSGAVRDRAVWGGFTHRDRERLQKIRDRNDAQRLRDRIVEMKQTVPIEDPQATAVQ